MLSLCFLTKLVHQAAGNRSEVVKLPGGGFFFFVLWLTLWFFRLFLKFIQHFSGCSVLFWVFPILFSCLSQEGATKVQEFRAPFGPSCAFGACREQGAAEGIVPNLWSWESAGEALADVLGRIPSLEQGDFM